MSLSTWSYGGGGPSKTASPATCMCALRSSRLRNAKSRLVRRSNQLMPRSIAILVRGASSRRDEAGRVSHHHVALHGAGGRRRPAACQAGVKELVGGRLVVPHGDPVDAP